MDYRQTLQENYQNRRGRNAGYSLRAFARDLGLAAPRLNEILAGKKGLSPEAAVEVARRLRLDGREQKLFVLSAESLHHRSAVGRKAAAARLREELAAGPPEPPRHTTVVHWTTEAVQKLIEREKFAATAESIAATLGIPVSLASSPLRYLTRAGLLPGADAGKAYIADRLRGKRLLVDFEQILELARKSFVAAQNTATDFYDHAPLLIDPDHADQARKILAKAVRDLRKLETTSPRGRLFYFSSQFFKVENERKKP